MARYIKANPKVVNYLHLENDRNKVKDGNYILWLQDMMQFGPLPRLAETLERIGAIALLLLGNERTLYDFITFGVEYLHDACVVRSPQTAADRILYECHAAYFCHSPIVGHRFL